MKPDMQTETTNHVPSNSVKDRVLSVINETGVAPRSKYVFWCQNWLVWCVWALSIFIGALSVAVLLFVSTHRYYDIYEAMYDNFFTFILEALPFIWFVVFAGMLALAAWQLKHTRRGYRLSTVVLGASSFVFSLVLGALFHIGGFGWTLDMWLGEVAPMYKSQAEMERAMWQNPDDGRLIGRQAINPATPTTTIVFADSTGAQWAVRIVDLSDTDRQYLGQGELVRLLGATVSTPERVFHACGVFPWMLDRPNTLARFNDERRSFMERMYRHHENAEARRATVEPLLAENAQNLASSSPCHTLAAVRRVYEQMQR